MFLLSGEVVDLEGFLQIHAPPYLLLVCVCVCVCGDGEGDGGCVD